MIVTPRWERLERRKVATLQCCVWKTTFDTSQRRNVAALFLENHVWLKNNVATSQRRSAVLGKPRLARRNVATSQRRSAVFGKPRLARRNAATSQRCFLETAFGTSTTSQRCSVVFEKPRFNAATFQRLVTTSQRSNVAAWFLASHVA